MTHWQIGGLIQTALGKALGLDPRFERQALWIGLQSGWLLADCRIDEGAAAQQESLAQLRLAVQANRLPAGEIEAYSTAFATDLHATKQRCSGATPRRKWVYMRAFSKMVVFLAASLVVSSCGYEDRSIPSERQPTPTPATTGVEPAPATTGVRPPNATTSVEPTAAQSSAGAAASPERPKSETERLLLARQVRLQQGGDGLFPNCRIDEDAPPQFKEDVAVWVHNLFSSSEYPDHTVLCLRGFDPSAPVEVVVTAGDYRARTHIQPVAGAPHADTQLTYEEESSTTLFDDGAQLSVYTQDYGNGSLDGPPRVLASEMWRFFPPETARNAIAEHGSFTITATQNDRAASLEQSVAVPKTRDYYLLSSTEDGKGLALVGFPAGATVPIGLYQDDKSEEASALFVDQIGTVTMPSSRVAFFKLPENLLTSRSFGRYYILPPVTGEASPDYLVNWPSYPGEISPGEHGRRAEIWQLIFDHGRYYWRNS